MSSQSCEVGVMQGRGCVGHALTRTPVGDLLSFLAGWEQVQLHPQLLYGRLTS